MFPVRVKRKDYVFGIRDVGAAKTWPLSGFTGGRVINDAVGKHKFFSSVTRQPAQSGPIFAKIINLRLLTGLDK